MKTNKTHMRRLQATLSLMVMATASGAMAEPVPVVQWDQFSNAGITAAGPAMEELIKVCEASLPDVNIERTVVPSIGIRESYRLAVSADKTPDLGYTWPKWRHSTVITTNTAGTTSTPSIAAAIPIRASSTPFRWNRT